MPKISQEESEQRRAHIIATAKKCFSEQGFQVTIEEICVAAGISKGAIYGYFQSKEAIIEAIANDHARNIEAFEAAPDIDYLTNLLMEAVNHGNPTTCCWELQAWSHSIRRPQLRDLIRHNFHSLRQATTRALDAMQSRGDVKLVKSADTSAYLLINFVFGIVASSAFVDDNESARIKAGLDALLDALIDR